MAGSKPPGFKLRLEVITEGYDGKFCWFHPMAGVIPGSPPTVVLSMQRWRTASSDVFYPVNTMTSRDLGKSWSEPVEHASLGRRQEAGGVTVGVCGCVPKWHAKTRKLVTIGQTVRYLNDKLIAIRPRETAWSVYDQEKNSWSPWRTLEMPGSGKFWNSGSGSGQRVHLKNGDILLPIYFKGTEGKITSSTIARCSFDGETLRYIEHGTEMTVPEPRGLGEPSLTFFEGRYYLTMRNDKAAYVATSKDGLHFEKVRRWTWDDGSELGSYNTQAHWVTHRDGLFLSYTRRGAQAIVTGGGSEGKLEPSEIWSTSNRIAFFNYPFPI
ncbi:MAG: sialidase family protein [Limisphaerales bacterium]